ncbi:MAG: CvpA family protein [Acidimicrobiia bacterium]
MTWYDWAVIAIVIALCARGWIKGAVREGIDVALLLFGTFIAFRMSPAIGSVIAGMANVPYEVARVIAGVAILAVLVVGSMLVGNVVASALKIVPGASSMNKMGGAAVGMVYALVVVVIGSTLLAAMPMPASARAAVDESMEQSAVGSTLTDPAGPVQPIVASASGEQLFGTVIAVRKAVGDRLSAGIIPIPLPSVDRSTLAPSQVQAQQVFDAMNLRRIEDGKDPLAWSPDLAIVATERATKVYSSGWLALDGRLPEALHAAGVPGTISTDMVVLAASPDGVIEAIETTTGYDSAVVDGTYRKAGVGVIDGPYGLVAVQVLTG